jgi:hypothetical protein
LNIYRHSFRAFCPTNKLSVDYLLTIESSRMIMIEKIQAAVVNLTGYHEEIADHLWARFGGRQNLVAHHHGTDVETIRP